MYFKTATIFVAGALSVICGQAVAQDKANPFFVVTEDSQPSKVVNATTGEVAPVFVGKDYTPPPDCTRDGWYTVETAKDEIVRCQTGERFKMLGNEQAAGVPDNVRLLRAVDKPKPGTNDPGPMGYEK